MRTNNGRRGAWRIGKVARAGALAAIALGTLADAQVLDEVVVTTRKRTERLQDVPIAIEALNQSAIEEKGIRDLADLAKNSSSIRFEEGFAQQDTRVGIRGLTNSQGRSQVAFLVDGIDVTTEAINSSGSGLLVNTRLLADVERIEIVKGPQSALYGRAAFAGAINYVTASPTEEFEAKVGVTGATEGRYELRGLLSGPVSETLGLRLNALGWSEDGSYVNSISGRPVGGGKGHGASLGADWQPTEALVLKGRLAWSHDEYDQRAVAVIPNDTLLPLPGVAVSAMAFPPSASPVPAASTYGDAAGKVVSYSENPLTGDDYPGTTSELLRATLIGEWTAAAGRFSSYTGFTKAESSQLFDADRLAVGRPDRSNGNQELDWITDTQQLSQELRWASDWTGPLQVTLGGLYWNESRRQSDRSYTALCLPALGACPAGTWQSLAIAAKPTIAPRVWRSETEHHSLYGLIEWQIAERFKATLETRWVSEDFNTTIFPAGCTLTNAPGGNRCPAGTPVTGEVDSQYQTPALILEWRASDQALLFLSAARAQKPGGITQAPGGGTTAVDIANLTFKPERMNAYELGLKSDWRASAGDLRFNVSAFFEDYTDKQASTNIIDNVTGLPTSRILNAAGAEVRGLEFDASYSPAAVEGLVVSIAYTYLDTEYTSFAGEVNSIAQNVALSRSCPTTQVGRSPAFPGGPLVPAVFCLVDRTGNEIERAPQHALVAGIGLTRPLAKAESSWFVDVSAQYVDERFGDDFNFTRFDAYWNVDLKLGLRNERWDALLFVDNAFDDDTIKTGLRTIDFANFGVAGFRFHYIGVLPTPRVVGLRATWRF